jgi:hypothetical protein
MTLATSFKQQFNGLVWRMEIDPITHTLFAEIRNEQDKLVSFASVNLLLGKLNFKDLILDERWLTGIETAYNGVLLLHNYESAGSPTHKGIVAIDAETGKNLWADYNRTLSHLTANGPVLFDARIQPRKLYTVDIKTGATLHAYTPSVDMDAELYVTLPEAEDTAHMDVSFLPEAPFGNIVHNHYHNHYRIVSLHALKSNELSQRLYIFKDGQQVFNDLLNAGIQKLQPEAFVLHNDHLIYLKNKVELNVINLKD